MGMASNRNILPSRRGMLWTIGKSLGEKWNDELKEAWAMCYVTLSSTMMNAVKYIKKRGDDGVIPVAGRTA